MFSLSFAIVTWERTFRIWPYSARLIVAYLNAINITRSHDLFVMGQEALLGFEAESATDGSSSRVLAAPKNRLLILIRAIIVVMPSNEAPKHHLTINRSGERRRAE